MERSNVENALTQVLENFQRSGITRFGALPVGELPAEMHAAVAHLTTLTDSPNVARRSAVGSQLTDSPNVAQRSAVGSQLEDSSNVARRSAVGSQLADSPNVARRSAVGSQLTDSPNVARRSAVGSKLEDSPNVARRSAVGSQLEDSPNVARRSAVGSQLEDSPNVARRSAVGSKLAPATPETTGQRATDLIPSTGLGIEPWSLPILSLEQRQGQFDELSGQVRDCRLCTAIVSYRQQTVFGAGPLNPRVCFMGEAPGADEDRTGQPFVGKAGQLLTKIITAMQLSREEVYILNALKCRPPQNRTPMNEEIEHCRHFVESQLDTLRPEFIVCLGAVAVRSILRSEMPIGRLRGQFYQYRGARVVVTYHPSYLLRNESAKKHVWEDMKMLMAELRVES